MEKKFEEAKALPLAPDAAILKSELDAMIKKYPLLADAAKSASGWKNWALELSGKLEEYSIDSKENREKMVADAASIQLMYSKMTNYTTTYFAPIQMQDYDRINLQFFSGKQAVNATPYRFYAKGGWKIDFSAGISMNGLNTKSYAYVDVNTENVNDTVSVTTGVIQDLSEAADYGVSTLMHVYPRFGWIFQPGFAVGAQLNNDQVTLLAGGSLMFGRQQRFCISGGMSFGPATKLKAGYEVGDRVEDSQAVNGGDVSFTHNVRSTSYFVSISYNLGGIN
jgi:hypothetical protein